MSALLIIAVLLVVILMTVAIAIKSLIVICPPNQVAVVSGRSRSLSDGATSATA